jgi:hypothetical protein
VCACVRGKATVPSLCDVLDHEGDGGRGRQHCISRAGRGRDLEDSLFGAVREHAESMIGRARSAKALGMEHHRLEERVIADGMEPMRLLTQAHLDLRALREQPAATSGTLTASCAKPPGTGRSTGGS